MAENQLPLEGQSLTVVLVRDGNVHVLTAVVIVAKPRSIALAFQLEDDKPRPARGDLLTLAYSNDVYVLRLRAEVVEVIGDKKALVRPLGEVSRGERREFIRAAANVRINAHTVASDYELIEGDVAQSEWRVWDEQEVNLSGSGIRFVTKEACKKGQFMHVQLVLLPLPAKPVVQLLGEVVRARSNDGNSYDVALNFASVQENCRDQLINCVFRCSYDQLSHQISAASAPE
jgi:hypothetical protein